MPKFRVQKKVVSYETVLVDASDAKTAETTVLTAGSWHRFKQCPESRNTSGTVENVTCLGEVETGAKQFDESSIYDMGSEYNGRGRFYFSGAMVSTCTPLLDDCDDNYDVANLLREHKVIRKGTLPDTESCDINLGFKTKRAAQSFIKRLNAFLRKRYEEVQNGKTFSVTYAA
jgi:hypothetical protein